MSDPQRAEELAFAYCVRRLTSAARTEHDLRTKMRERGYEDDVADAVLARLRRIGYVNDAEFAAAWVRTRSVSKALTSSALRAELRRKGVADDLIDRALEQVSAGDEDARARELLLRKAPAQIPTDRAERDRIARRLGGVLARKGYPSGRVWAIVNDVLDEREREASCS